MQNASQTKRKGLRVRIYINGDDHFPGRNINVRNPHLITFDKFLDEVTAGLRPKFGSVYRLYHAETGQRVKSLDQVENDAPYVAAPMERFRRLNYTGIVDARTKTLRNHERATTMAQAVLPPMRRQSTSLVLPPVPPSTNRVVRSGRAYKQAAEKPVIIRVVRNGLHASEGVKLILHKRNRLTWEQVLRQIEERVPLSNDALFKVVDTSGNEVNAPEQLDHKGTYVACGRKLPFQADLYERGSTRNFNSSTKVKRLPHVRQKRARLARAADAGGMAPGHSPSSHGMNMVPHPPTSHQGSGQKAAALPGIKPSRPSNEGHVNGLDHGSVSSSPERQQLNHAALLKPIARVQSFSLNITPSATAVSGWAGSSAAVFVTLLGTDGQLHERDITDDVAPIEPGVPAVAAVEGPPVGDITGITIRKADTGEHDCLPLDRVTVRDTKTNQKYVFHFNHAVLRDGANLTVTASLDGESGSTAVASLPSAARGHDGAQKEEESSSQMHAPLASEPTLVLAPTFMEQDGADAAENDAADSDVDADNEASLHQDGTTDETTGLAGDESPREEPDEDTTDVRPETNEGIVAEHQDEMSEIEQQNEPPVEHAEEDVQQTSTTDMAPAPAHAGLSDSDERKGDESSSAAEGGPEESESETRADAEVDESGASSLPAEATADSPQPGHADEESEKESAAGGEDALDETPPQESSQEDAAASQAAGDTGIAGQVTRAESTAAEPVGATDADESGEPELDVKESADDATDKPSDTAEETAAEGEEKEPAAEETAAEGEEKEPAAEEIAAEGEEKEPAAEETAAEGEEKEPAAEEIAAEGNESQEGKPADQPGAIATAESTIDDADDADADAGAGADADADAGAGADADADATQDDAEDTLERTEPEPVDADAADDDDDEDVQSTPQAEAEPAEDSATGQADEEQDEASANKEQVDDPQSEEQPDAESTEGTGDSAGNA